MDIYYITTENYTEACDATRDNLYLYHDAVTSYAGFGHNLDLGTFDPFRYLYSPLGEPPGYILGLDLNLC